MVFGLSSNPALGTYTRERSLCVIVTCPSVIATMAQIPYVIPVFIAIAGQNSPSVRLEAFCKEKVLERLQMGANRKDLFYYLVSSRTLAFGVFVSQKTRTEWRGAA